MTIFQIPFDIRSTIIVTESADIESASDLIVNLLQSDKISDILVQESIGDKFIQLLEAKVKATSQVQDELKNLFAKGFEVIANKIVKCSRSIISNQQASVVSLEIFRTTKEGITLSKSSPSIGLWCENISIAFEYANALNAQQIWLNSSFGAVNSKIPFINTDNNVVCEDAELRKNILAGTNSGSLIEIAGSIQFQTTFQNAAGKFKTIVIPFGESFAN